MLDIKFIRQNPEIVKDACKKKLVKINVDEFLQLDKKRRELLSGIEEMRAKKNQANKEIQKAKDKNEREGIINRMKIVDKDNEKINAEYKELDAKFQKLLLEMPNIPSEDSPIGDEKNNKEVEQWGKAPKFDFKIKDHLQIGKDLDLIDIEKGAQAGGFRGYYLKNEAALMHWAIISFGIEKIVKKGFNLFLPPTLVREFVLEGSGHFPACKEDIYQIGNPGKLADGDTVKEPIFLTGTSESALLAYYADTILDEKDLPLKLAGVSQCYRSEAGSYGKDTKGLYRLHEFMKVEQVVFCKADIEESRQWLEDMRKISQEVLKDLKLPHRVISIATGDMGLGKYKMYDIETWMPSRNNYGETHSDSSLTDWQARRLNIRYKDKQGQIKFVHTLNNTVIASPRILIAILENYQQKDGSIKVPEALKKYLNFKVIKKK